jgi:hypothetical protein
MENLYGFLSTFVASLILLELFCRWRFGVAAAKVNLNRGVAATLYLMKDKVWQEKAQLITNPYSLYWNKPNSWVEGVRTTCSRGYRWHGREISDQDIDYRIVVLGGSTTFSNYCFQDYRKTWCYQLETFLKAAIPDLKIEVINAGLNYATSAELLSHFVFRAQHLNPDLVILHGPGNDSLPAALGDYSTDYSETRDFVYHTRRPAEKDLLVKFGLMRCLYSIWLDSPHYAKLEPLVFPDNDIQRKNLDNCHGDTFIKNINSFINICVEKRITFAYLPFIYAPMQRMQEYHGDLSNDIRKFEARLTVKVRERINNLNSKAVHFIEYAESDFHNDDFFDSCHLLESGEKKKADIVAKEIIDLLTSK